MTGVQTCALPICKEAQTAGILHAKATAPEKYQGRPPAYTRQQVEQVIERHQQGDSISVIARTTELNRQTIYRIIRDPGAAAAALEKWGR